MKITRTERFKKAWRRLSEGDKALARKALKNLERDLGYPGLKTKKMEGTKDIWEARVSRSSRMTFNVEGGEIILRNIGRHDETLERP